jgi:hypothetical protein
VAWRESFQPDQLAQSDSGFISAEIPTAHLELAAERKNHKTQHN